ncbi:Right handed beta helix region [Micromonospora purpureochromogenes]|uniref:Right handed beta helix region n=1 Tax=Micromonospora purpureochromogenes TaxID=47872 RepID=A0A1C4YD56_9ACTN|nr:DUF6519 domain-containing protein [Micromonospora purpureochromogenes]SCF18614.1 Right handed beta helix region [Micromonospora purpureochromogenes]
MKGDISRSTFDQRRHATSVRKQQGRVDLDADWNEQQDIQAHLRTTALTDLVGPAGAPLTNGAFALTGGGGDLKLSAGRYYLDGVLCENDAQVSVFAQPDLPAAGPFVRKLDGAWLAAGAAVPAGVYVAWLQAWSQHVTAIEDAGLREVALGGPDTATRLRTVWQVRLVQAGPPNTPVGCADTPPGWAELTAASTGTLAVRADPTGAPGGDCVIPTGSPYTGLDNQCYRVEILAGGAPGAATYVWSRDNGSTVATWESIDVDVLTVKVPGRDGSAGFANGSWVELTDDTREQNATPGTLVQVDRVEGDRIVIRPATATGSLNRADFPRRPRVRRWDGRGTVPAGGAELDLELGIKIRFGAAGSYRTGDWWSFPARSAVHDVEWPRTGTTPVPQTPHGPRRAHGRLGVLGYDGSQWSVLRDCRPVFAPLIGQLTLSLLGGDGQEAVPVPNSPATLVPLGHDLAAGVSTGGQPVAKARVRFTVTIGQGKLTAGATTASTVTVETGTDGRARCAWQLDSGTATQEVTAQLLDEAMQPAHLPLTFTAGLSRADRVSYDPTGRPSLAGATTVQAAINQLAAASTGGWATLTLRPGIDWVQALNTLPAGDALICFAPGLYTSNTPVTFSNRANIRLLGSGPASRIQVQGHEYALLFANCGSVSLSHLFVETPGPADSSGRLGPVSAINCTEVTVEHVRLAGVAGAAPRSTCLTVRNDQGTPPGRVRVLDSDFLIGHGQQGVLLVNPDHAVVTRCRFSTPPRPLALTLQELVKDEKFRGELATQLVGRLALDRADRLERGDFNTVVRVGQWGVRMNSTVPESEWKTLAALNPPTPEDLRSDQSAGAYLHRLADLAAADPSRLPSYKRQLSSLKGRLGDAAGRIFDTDEGRKALRDYLVGEGVNVRRADDIARDRRDVALPAPGASLRFDSALAQGAWEAALAASPPSRPVQTPSAAAKHLRSVADRILLEPAFGDRYAAGYRKELAAAAEASIGACGVVIGGGTAVGDVEVSDCRFDQVAEGVHIGVSYHPGPPIQGRTIRVTGNDIHLVKAWWRGEGTIRGIKIGSMRNVFVSDNRISVSGGTGLGIWAFAAGGPILAVRDNLVQNCNPGIMVNPLWSGAPAKRLWSVTDNVSMDGLIRVEGGARNAGNVS